MIFSESWFYVWCIIATLTRRWYPTNLFCLQATHMNMIISSHKLKGGAFLCLTDINTQEPPHSISACSCCLSLGQQMSCRWSVLYEPRWSIPRFGGDHHLNEPEFFQHTFNEHLLLSDPETHSLIFCCFTFAVSRGHGVSDCSLQFEINCVVVVFIIIFFFLQLTYSTLAVSVSSYVRFPNNQEEYQNCQKSLQQMFVPWKAKACVCVFHSCASVWRYLCNYLAYHLIWIFQLLHDVLIYLHVMRCEVLDLQMVWL